jgi:uncharacterized metal-binding protein YceD (DUF177 family)
MSLKRPNPETLPISEFFYPVHVDEIPSKGKTFHLSASGEQCAAISKRLNIVSLSNLSADVNVTLQNAGHIAYISGQLKADMVQECVATLQPINSQIEEGFEAWYADHDKVVPFSRAKHNQQTLDDGMEVQMLEEHEDPEALINGQVDLGEVIIQYLSLSINPYPRLEGVEEAAIPTTKTSVVESAPSSRPNPFAALKNWRPKD